MSCEKQKEIFNSLVKERALEFSDIKAKTDPNDLVYILKTGGNEPKDFGNYQMPFKLFEDLRDGYINPKEVLKTQVRFQSDLSEVKTGGKKSPNQKNTIQSKTTFFYLQERIIDFFRAYSFLLSEPKYKTKYGGGLKI